MAAPEMVTWGENVDVLMAMVNVGGDSPFDQFERAKMLAKMRKTAPIILHSGIAITPEEYAARLITGIKVFGTPIGCKMDWNTDMIKMSDLSYAAGGLTHEEYKVLNARCNGGCRSSSQCVSMMDDAWERAMVIIKDLGGWEEIEIRKKCRKERERKAIFRKHMKMTEAAHRRAISGIKAKQEQLNEKAAALRREADDAEARAHEYAHKMIELESRENEEFEKWKQEAMATEMERPKYKRPKRIA